MEKYANYYVPFDFGWDRILGKKGAFSVLYEEIKDQRIIENTYDFEYRYREESNGGNIIHINTLTDINFTILNLEYISKLYDTKKERKPSYVQMLESGTPALDVLKTIKTYNLQGSDIVFLGSANSINSQGGALIVVDGVNRGTDASILSNLSPFEVETITASTNPVDIQRYTALNSVGLIEITLKKAKPIDKVGEEMIDQDMDFKESQIATDNDQNDHDFRSTLWWERKTVNSNEQSANFIYFNSELNSDVQGKIYFIPKSGIPSTTDFSYSVK